MQRDGMRLAEGSRVLRIVASRECPKRTQRDSPDLLSLVRRYLPSPRGCLMDGSEPCRRQGCLDLARVVQEEPEWPSDYSEAKVDSFVERPVRDGPWSARVSGREAPRAVGC